MLDEIDDGTAVAPLVACQSNGGVYDDASFQAGYQAAGITAILATRRHATWETFVRPDLVRQADLTAMSTGYTTVTRAAPLGWVRMIFTRVDDA